MKLEEKLLILGSLFHDVGKFEQSCSGNPDEQKHTILGANLIDDKKLNPLFKDIVGNENIPALKNIILEHHNTDIEGLTSIVREADRLSAGLRVDREEKEVYQDRWDNKHMSSLFSKIKLLSNDKIDVRYYKHNQLTKKQFDVIFPTGTNELDLKQYAYTEKDWELFKDDLEYILSNYKNDEDFDSLINLLLVIFEKYLWCIPDINGSSETDVSLYNHLKDVAGISHAIYLTKDIHPKSRNLNIVIGDIPGIQNYIFDVVNVKPAKILRGRSIFVQIFTRNLATKLLKNWGLTEASLIMLAGGKFYIIAPDTQDFKESFRAVKREIENYLFEHFRMELSFNCAYHTFDISELLKENSTITFGSIIEEASHKLIQNRYELYNNRLFPSNKISYDSYIWPEKYIDSVGSGTDSMKCKVTDKPIRKNRKETIKIPSENGFDELVVDKQVAIEYEIGSKIVGNNLIALLNEDDLSIDPKNIVPLTKFKKSDDYKDRIKILLNPTITDLLNNESLDKEVYRNTYYLEVANFCSRGSKDEVMPFEDMNKENEGAKFLSLIKGDIDNLGLIMAYGLTSDRDNFAGISRTTTLSYHLKYYFSFFLNSFLENWEKQKPENKVYTIFAGGDDLMLIAPQCSAIKLIKVINDDFKKFTCSNREVHISYSVRHFKDRTPIRIVADLAEENQKRGKKHTKEQQSKLLRENNNSAFLDENDKAGTFLFETVVKNDLLENLLSYIQRLTLGVIDSESSLSHELVEKLLKLSDKLKKYEETDDASYLIAYARLTNTVNRLLKNSEGEIRRFFNNVLTINKEDNEEAKLIGEILHPLVNQVIYNIRTKGE